MKISKLPIIFVAVLISLLTVTTAHANPICNWFGYCLYESPGFSIKVVDQNTGQPLADVHALAEWTQYGFHGSGGVLIAQDAVSAADGVLKFPAWGPTRGSSRGLVLNQDPVVSLFKPGYVVLIIHNAPGSDERAHVRGLKQDGQTFKLEPFRGPLDVWIKELRLAASPAHVGVPLEAQAEMRTAYLNRFVRLFSEAQKLPISRKEVQQLINYLTDRINYTQGDGQR